MFDRISQKQFDTEREARIKAESELALWRQKAELLAEQLLALTWAHNEQRAAHERQLAQLLEMVKPIPPPVPAPPETASADSPFIRLSAEEILAEPASGKRQMYVRQQRAALARARDEQQAAKQEVEARMKALTEEERKVMAPDAFDHTLGVFIAATEHEHDSN